MGLEVDLKGDESGETQDPVFLQTTPEGLALGVQGTVDLSDVMFKEQAVLNDLADVNSSPTSGEFLKFDGSKWIADTTPVSGKAKVSQNDTAAQFLKPSIVAGTNLEKNVPDDGAGVDEQLELSVSDSVATDQELSSGLAGKADTDLGNTTDVSSSLNPDFSVSPDLTLGSSSSPWDRVIGDELISTSAALSAPKTVIGNSSSTQLDQNSNPWKYKDTDPTDSATNAAGFQRYQVGAEADPSSYARTISASDDRAVDLDTSEPAEEPIYQDSQGDDYEIVNREWSRVLRPGEYRLITSPECSAIIRDKGSDNSFDPDSINYVETRIMGIGDEGCSAGIAVEASFLADEFTSLDIHYSAMNEIGSAPPLNYELYRRDASTGNASKIAEKMGDGSSQDRYNKLSITPSDISSIGANPVKHGERLIVRAYLHSDVTLSTTLSLHINRIELLGR